MLLAGLLQAGGLTFEKTTIDQHVKADAETTEAEFPFENKTDKPLTIARVEKSCAACMAAEVKDGKLVYQPGEKGAIRVKFQVGTFAGVVNKMILVWLANDPAEKPSGMLTLNIHVPVLVELSPKTVTWYLDEKIEPRKITITMRHSKPIRMLKATCTNEAFALELKTVKDGAEYELWITPPAAGGPGIGIIRMETDCDLPRHKIHQAFAVVRKPMQGGAAPGQ
jgi:hypothetical protein